MNKKGFMMAELVVVSSIIIISLTGLYMSYNKIITSYRQIINYYDIGLKYKLGYYYQILNNNQQLYNDSFKKVNTLEYLDLSDDLSSNADNEVIYLVNGKSSLASLRGNVTNETFKDYINYLDGSLKSTAIYLMIGEKCSTNEDKCKYAYLEVIYEETK